MKSLQAWNSWQLKGNIVQSITVLNMSSFALSLLFRIHAFKNYGYSGKMLLRQRKFYRVGYSQYLYRVFYPLFFLRTILLFATNENNLLFFSRSFYLLMNEISLKHSHSSKYQKERKIKILLCKVQLFIPNTKGSYLREQLFLKSSGKSVIHVANDVYSNWSQLTTVGRKKMTFFNCTQICSFQFDCNYCLCQAWKVRDQRLVLLWVRRHASIAFRHSWK